MSNPISETQIQEIISNFNVNIVEYEIIDMEKYQGWSSKQLYLLVSAGNNYILKAKSIDQTTGYDDEVKICNALLESGIQTRRPIITKNGTIFYEKNNLFWCLMTYVPGAQSHVDEYTQDTVKSLAEHIDQYISSSNSQENLKNLNIKRSRKQDEIQALNQFITEKDFLESLGILHGETVKDLHMHIISGYEKCIRNLRLESIIHNDINPRNILFDHSSRDVIALIDWDHVCYGNPLKDLSDAVSIFYDYLPTTKAIEYKNLFYSYFKSTWFTKIDPSTVELAFLFYYTVAKWQAILFYLNLLREYDNKYGEHDRFINEMKQIYSKWLGTVTAISK